MKKLALLHLGVAVLSLAAACAESPSKPGGATPIAALSIQSSGGLLLGETATLAAVATLPGGQTQAVSGTWSSDNAAVATVEATTGRITAQASGSATVSFDYAGHRASQTIVIRPNYAGTWTARYVITACRRNFGSGACRQTATAQAEWPLTMQLSQSGGTVTGRLFVSGGNGMIAPESQLDLTNPVVAGTIALDGSLTMTEKQTLYAWPTYPMASYEVTVALTADRASLTGTIDLKRTDFKDPGASETATGTIQRIAR